MRKSVLFILLAAICVGGCFNIRTPKPISGEVEESFKNRWIAKRMGELQTSGKAADARDARAQALEEFRKTYPYTRAAQKPDPVSATQ
jgi:hypothetical protein